MTKFMVTYMGSSKGKLDVDMSEVDGAAFMQAWADWAEKHKASIVDGGAPLGKTKLATSSGVTDTKNAITGYTMVEADSHDAAAQMFVDHPHAVMMKLPIEIMEVLDIPGM